MSAAPGVDQQTFALRLEYDGTDYCGSQLQANGPSIQGELERALAPLAGEARRVRLAGRTDAGVHASGQVAAVDLPPHWTASPLLRALNARLPQDIAVTAAVVAPAGFDPRRAARARRYRYTALDATVRAPLLRRSVWLVKHALDDDAMRASAAALVGEHDFAAFAGPPDRPGLSTVRLMKRVELRRRGSLLLFEFEATAFLPHQVRRTVGAAGSVAGQPDVAAVIRAARPASSSRSSGRTVRPVAT